MLIIARKRLLPEHIPVCSDVLNSWKLWGLCGGFCGCWGYHLADFWYVDQATCSISVNMGPDHLGHDAQLKGLKSHSWLRCDVGFAASLSLGFDRGNGQCQIPILEGWGGRMPKTMKSTTCQEGGREAKNTFSGCFSCIVLLPPCVSPFSMLLSEESLSLSLILSISLPSSLHVSLAFAFLFLATGFVFHFSL